MLDLLTLQNVDETNINVYNEFIKLEFLNATENVIVNIYLKEKKKWSLIGTSYKQDQGTEKTSKLLEISHAVSSNALKLSVYNVMKNKEEITVILKGKNQFYQVIIQYTLKDKENFVHVKNILTIFTEIKLEYFMNSYSFTPRGKNATKLDFAWIPNLRPYKDCVIGDHVFRAPAIILQKNGISMNLIPDLELLSNYRKMKTSLNYIKSKEGIETPYISYGFMEYDITHHVYYEHKRKMRRKLKNTQLTFGYYIICNSTKSINENLRVINNFLWKKFAKPLFDTSVRPQIIPFNKYAEYGYNALFNNFKNTWEEFECDSKICGGYFYQTWSGGKKNPEKDKEKLILNFDEEISPGFIFKIFNEYLASSHTFYKVADLFVRLIKGLPAPRLIFNQAWFNNLRSAVGIKLFADKWGDKDLGEKAVKMKNLSLSAPEAKGLFHTILNFYHKDGELQKQWIPGSLAIHPINYFHIPDCSWTAYWLLKWYELHEKDKEILKKCKTYANTLLNLQEKDGSIPTWVKVVDDSYVVHEYLKNSASTACSIFFLTKLHEVTNVKKYLESAKKAAKFIENNVIPENKWFDYETFFSCSPKDLDMIDEYTGIYPQNNLSLWWAAESFKELYKITNDSKFLNLGVYCIELLCLYQQVWNAPYISINTFGGFGVMNTDAEWNDARQSKFALTLMEYYELTRNEEYFERGIAALRASFTLMLINENKEIAPGNFKNFNEFDIGATYENYGHCGRDKKILGYIMFDWGSASSSCAAALALMKYGDIYVDVKNHKAFGINGIIVLTQKFKENKITLSLRSEIDFARKLTMRFDNLELEKYEIVINKKKIGVKTKKQLTKGIQIESKFLNTNK
ncbi:MAG: hypothetical protein ACTSX4_02950 [Candidatus Helarchaeota archaeon]